MLVSFGVSESHIIMINFSKLSQEYFFFLSSPKTLIMSVACVCA